MTNKIIIAGLVALAFVGGSIMTGTMADAAKGEPNGQPFQELQTQIDGLEPDPRVDSFFDVFYEIYAAPDSFFDIFVDPGTGEHVVDSFFDVFTEISVHDADIALVQTEIVALQDNERLTISNIGSSGEDGVSQIPLPKGSLQSQIDTIETEILSMDLRGESCNMGDVVNGVDPAGNLICTPGADSTGTSWTELTDVPAGFADGTDDGAQPGTYSIQRVGDRLVGPVNNFDQFFDFRCAPNEVLSGVQSIHDNGREDRQFWFYCSQLRVSIP